MGNIKDDKRYDMDVGTRKLSVDKQMELVKRLAWHWKPQEIIKFLKDEYGIRVSPLNIRHYMISEKWKPILTKFRDEYHRNLTEVPLANKRKRLDELEKLYDKAIKAKKYDEAKSLIREFREEMERKVGEVSFNFTSVTHNEFHGMNDEDLQKEKMKTIEQLEKVRKMKLLAHKPELSGDSDELQSEEKEETISDEQEERTTDEEGVHHE